MDILDQHARKKTMPVADDVFLNAGGPLAGLISKIQQTAAANAPSVATTLALSDSALSAALVKWVTQAQPAFANSNPSLTPQYNSMLSFFSNTGNMPYVRQAMQTYGIQLVPLVSISGKLQYGAGTWEQYWRLWKAAYYYSQYQIPPANSAYCTEIATLIGALAQEISNLRAQQTQGTLNAAMFTNTVFVVNDIQSTVTGMYASLDCVSAQQQQQTGQNLDLLNTATGALANSSASSGGVAITYGLYAVAGLMVVGALALIFHHSKKSAA